MKKIVGILILSLSLFTACDNDLLEPFTPGSLPEDEAINNSVDLERLRSSAMNFMTNRSEYVFSSIYTDEAAIGFNNGGQGVSSDYIFLMNPSNESADAIWRANYTALSRLNRIIKSADEIVPTSPENNQIIKRIKAQALVLRAICHLKIMSYYSTNPADDTKLAGILSNRIILTTETPARATNAAFYTLIHADLDNAIALFNTNTAPPYVGITKTYFPSKTLAQAIKARAYALKKDFVNAELFANEVITTSNISLANSIDAYKKVFHTHDENADTEVIFRLRRTVQQNSQNGNQTYTNNVPNYNANLHNGWGSIANRRNGSPFYEVSRALFNKFGGFNQSIPNINQNPDYRLRAVVFLEGTSITNSIVNQNYATATNVRNTDILVLQKHGGQAASTSSGDFNPDFMVARISEMYLIKAEARAFANDFGGVATTLQNIINTRFTTPYTVPTPANAQAAWKLILDERRKELCFEGFRFIDLKRLGTLANSGIDRDPSDYSSTSWNFPAGAPANLPLTSHKFTLPIPISELNANSGITQNTGY